jgi:hypothetical protein
MRLAQQTPCSPLLGSPALVVGHGPKATREVATVQTEHIIFARIAEPMDCTFSDRLDSPGGRAAMSVPDGGAPPWE